MLKDMVERKTFKYRIKTQQVYVSAQCLLSRPHVPCLDVLFFCEQLLFIDFRYEVCSRVIARPYRILDLTILRSDIQYVLLVCVVSW